MRTTVCWACVSGPDALGRSLLLDQTSWTHSSCHEPAAEALSCSCVQRSESQASPALSPVCRGGGMAWDPAAALCISACSPAGFASATLASVALRAPRARARWPACAGLGGVLARSPSAHSRLRRDVRVTGVPSCCPPIRLGARTAQRIVRSPATSGWRWSIVASTPTTDCSWERRQRHTHSPAASTRALLLLLLLPLLL